jgi:MoaA/NifB/PqqE/SkfB family radical SAM enzyme
MKFLAAYPNGNYLVSIYDDGTKIRENDLDNLTPEFSESIDMKITNYCDKGCPFCHENSTKYGNHAVLDENVWKMIETIKPYTELAIGGGNPLSHPKIEDFLIFCRDRKILANITLNEFHFQQDFDRVKRFVVENLIRGLGISINVDVPDIDLLEKIKMFPNAAIHTIAGVTSFETYRLLAKNEMKVLILGFKQFRQGKVYYRGQPVENKISELKENLTSIWNKFKVLSFDNLALIQLDIGEKLPSKIWDVMYMGDDGQYTYYIDLVDKAYARNSTSNERFDLVFDVNKQFKHVQNLKNV